MISELFLTKFSIILKRSPSCCWWNWKHEHYSAFWLPYLEKVPVLDNGKLISSCVYFSFYLFFFPALRCISMQPAFRSRTWKCLAAFKAQREVSGPAPLNPDRFSFAWCGCQVDALASFPRTNEIAPLCIWKKHVFLNCFFRQDNSCQMYDWCRPSLMSKGTSLDSTMNY